MEVILTIIFYPGYLLACLLGKIKQMGDGTDNESVEIEIMKWSLVFAVVFWVSIGYLVFWLFKHVSVSIS
ncbi:MAG: hypothetical protein MRY49_02875 [Candidatus Pacebacteria bacterium]|nr:hypothetical protein [Candidatus Paceibacterota bacterium]